MVCAHYKHNSHSLWHILHHHNNEFCHRPIYFLSLSFICVLLIWITCFTSWTWVEELCYPLLLFLVIIIHIIHWASFPQWFLLGGVQLRWKIKMKPKFCLVSFPCLTPELWRKSSYFCLSICIRAICILRLQHLLTGTLCVVFQAVWALGNIAGDNAECRDYVLNCGILPSLQQ